MNRNLASLLFLAAAVFFAGCSNHPDSFGEAGSPSSSGPSGSAGSGGSTGPGGSAMPADTDLAAFALAGIADPAYADAREVNDVSFVSDENPDAFNELF